MGYWDSGEWGGSPDDEQGGANDYQSFMDYINGVNYAGDTGQQVPSTLLPSGLEDNGSTGDFPLTGSNIDFTDPFSEGQGNGWVGGGYFDNRGNYVSTPGEYMSDSEYQDYLNSLGMSDAGDSKKGLGSTGFMGSMDENGVYTPNQSFGKTLAENVLKFLAGGNSGIGTGSPTNSAGAAITAGKSAAAAAQGRKSEAEILNDLMRNQISRGQLQINQSKFNLDKPAALAKQSVMGDTLANAQDVTIQPWNNKIVVPKVTGGLRPSMFSDSTRQLGQKMSSDALANDTPTPFTPINDPKYPEAGFMENLNNGIVDGTTILNLIRSIFGG